MSFNAAEDENEPDKRSDDRGPEPEPLAIGRISNRSYAFVGFERVGGIVAYDVTKNIRLALEGFNLLDREDDDIAYFYASRLPDEPLDGIEDVHFHPMEKPSVRVTLVWKF